MEVRLYQNLLEFNWNLLFTAVTVFVLYLILKHFFFEKVHNFMMARKAMIEEELMNADQESKKASKLLEEYSKTLANAEEEKRQIIKEAKVIADERADAIVSDAKKEAAQIIVDAHKKIERPYLSSRRISESLRCSLQSKSCRKSSEMRTGRNLWIKL